MKLFIDLNSVYSHISQLLPMRSERQLLIWKKSIKSFPPPCITHWSSTIFKLRSVGAFLTKSYPCHNKKATNDDNHDDECKETIKLIIGQFHHVKYSFFDKKGNVIAKVLPAVCSQNDLEDHLFLFMKKVRKNKYILGTTGRAWIHQDDVVRLLAFPNLTRRGECKWQ